MKSNISIDFNNMMSDAIGKHGISDEELKHFIDKHKKDFNNIKEKKGAGWLEWCELPYADAKEIQDYVSTVKEKFETLVVFGIGGSALGTKCIATALLNNFHNEIKNKKAPKLYIIDNVDPEQMYQLLDNINLEKTLFNIITKSGETSETLAQFFTLYEIMKNKLHEKVTEHFVFTTTIGKGSLYEFAKEKNIKVFPVGKGVGGRFSVLSAVGLLPLALVGIDINGLLNGAKIMSERCLNLEQNLEKNPAVLLSMLHLISMQKGINISVLMPYAQALQYVSDFFAQLWAESLGKAIDNDGKIINCGQTPVKALGVTDQHSQLQLYTEGPFDKIIAFICVKNFRENQKIINNTKYASFLNNHTFNELINCEYKATAYALRKQQRLNYTIYLDSISENSIGELLTLFMYQTAFTGASLNIDTFNQPGVEEGKKATFAMFNREGYQDKLKELNDIKYDNKYKI